MNFDIEGAKKAGYTDKEIENFLQARTHKKFDTIAAKKAGYTDKEIENFLAKNNIESQEKSKAQEPFSKQVQRSALQLPLGALEASPVGLGSQALQMLGKGEGLAELEELEGRLPELREKFPGFNIPEKIDRDKYLKAVDQAAETFPTVGNIARDVEKSTGLPLTPKTGVDKALRFVSSISGFAKGSPIQKIQKGLKGESMRTALESSGVPEPVSDALALYYALHEKTPVGPKLPQEKKAVVPSEATSSENKIASSEIKKMASGLTEPKAVESEFSKIATISPERQKYAIEKLNKEASELSKKAVETHLPISKKIEEGFDFESQFNNNFRELRSMAQKANPHINLRPLSDFMKETREKYKGIPTLHPEAQKIMREISNFRKNPESELNNLLKIFRSNNRKRSTIYERSRLLGKEEEYVDFLGDFNKAISESIKKTLPEDSEWLKRFLNNNKDYSNYLNAQKTLNSLKPILEGEITTAKINKLATDTKVHKKLALTMGKKGADEVVQIAKDLKKATESLKKIPTKELKAWDAVFPIGLIIPYVKIPAAAVSAYRGGQAARNLFGFYLSTPARTKVYGDAIKAVSENNLPAYKKATEELKKSINLDEAPSKALKTTGRIASKVFSSDQEE